MKYPNFWALVIFLGLFFLGSAYLNGAFASDLTMNMQSELQAVAEKTVLAKKTKAKKVCALVHTWSIEQRQAVLAVWQYVASTQQDLWGAALKKAVLKPRNKQVLRFYQVQTDSDQLTETTNIIQSVPNAMKQCWWTLKTAIWAAKNRNATQKVVATLRDVVSIIDAGIKAGDPQAQRAAGHFVTALRALK